eukprot:scaffold33302_cov129-Isochrysis_galbana.AAC.5
MWQTMYVNVTSARSENLPCVLSLNQADAPETESYKYERLKIAQPAATPPSHKRPWRWLLRTGRIRRASGAPPSRSLERPAAPETARRRPIDAELEVPH